MKVLETWSWLICLSSISRSHILSYYFQLPFHILHKQPSNITNLCFNIFSRQQVISFLAQVDSLHSTYTLQRYVFPLSVSLALMKTLLKYFSMSFFFFSFSFQSVPKPDSPPTVPSGQGYAHFSCIFFKTVLIICVSKKYSVWRYNYLLIQYPYFNFQGLFTIFYFTMVS